MQCINSNRVILDPLLRETRMQTRRRCKLGRWLLLLWFFLTAINVGVEVTRRLVPLPVDCNRSLDPGLQSKGLDIDTVTQTPPPPAEHSPDPPAASADDVKDAEALEKAWQAVFGHGRQDASKPVLANPRSTNAPLPKDSSAASSG